MVRPPIDFFADHRSCGGIAIRLETPDLGVFINEKGRSRLGSALELALVLGC